MFQKNNVKECCGTPMYMAPETLMMNRFSFASDIWALGCILYEFCMLSPLFGFVKVKSNDYSLYIKNEFFKIIFQNMIF